MSVFDFFEAFQAGEKFRVHIIAVGSAYESIVSNPKDALELIKASMEISSPIQAIIITRLSR